jgi:hypothetical protein
MSPNPALRLAAAALVAALCGCTTMLPTSKKEVVSNWTSDDDAVQSLSAIEPYTATRRQVHTEWLDPSVNPAITVLHFGDVLQRFSAAALIKPQDVDGGIRDCLHAGQQCSVYAISVKKIDSKRVGNFWLDFMNFKREAVSTGWSVDALLVFVDELPVYELIGVHPTIDDCEVTHNPMGPLQGWGTVAIAFR